MNNAMGGRAAPIRQPILCRSFCDGEREIHRIAIIG
jgi:hypothetical protein